MRRTTVGATQASSPQEPPQLSATATSLTSSTALQSQPSSVTAAVHRLPREVMHRVFMEVIDGDRNNFAWMAELSCVCRRWRELCLDPIMWEFVAKRSFVVYPLVLRLEYDAALDSSSQEFMNAVHRLGVRTDTGGGKPLGPELHYSRDPVPPLRAPTREVLRQTVDMVRHYRVRQQHYKYVQRRRSFVLHVFLSATLLSLTIAITAAMCAAEGVPVPLLCTRQASFTFLWLCYLCIVAIIVSNVVMQAHFEPQPLLLRLRRNKLLIIASAAVIILGVIDVMVPTVLIQINMSRERRFSWLWCGTTVILSFCAWQCYALMCIMPDARAHLQHQLTSLSVKDGVQFVMMNVPNAFPLFFAVAAFCALQYVQRGSRLYVFLGGVPVAVSLGVLALVFLLDYLSLHRNKDICVALCLFTAMFFPISLLWWEFRGWCLLPLAGSVLGFFLAHVRFVVRRALQKLRELEDSNVPIATQRNGGARRIRPDGNLSRRQRDVDRGSIPSSRPQPQASRERDAAAAEGSGREGEERPSASADRSDSQERAIPLWACEL